MKVKSLSCVQLLATLWTAAHQAPPSMGFSRQEYWSGVPLPSPEGIISKHKFQENGYICGSSTKTTQRAPKLAVIFFKLGSRSLNVCYCSLVQFSHSVVSDSLWPHGLQHARLPCPSPTPEACSDSCPSSHWCHPTISSSINPFSCFQFFPASGSFSMSQFFTSGGQSIGVSASASVLPMNIQDWSPSGWTGLLSLTSKGLSRVFSNTTVQKHQFFGAQLSF